MTQIQLNPLNEGHLQALNQVISNCACHQEAIEKARKAGIPVDHLHDQNKLHWDTATAMKREFFPDMS
jgi:hypothetical protein